MKILSRARIFATNLVLYTKDNFSALLFWCLGAMVWLTMLGILILVEGDIGYSLIRQHPAVFSAYLLICVIGTLGLGGWAFVRAFIACQLTSIEVHRRGNEVIGVIRRREHVDGTREVIERTGELLY